MTPKRVVELSFSPCGNTSKVAHIVAEELAKKYNIELVVDKFTLPKEREALRTFSESDLLVIASPTYAGKLPNKILPDFQEKIKADGAKAIAIVTYGNRSFDNSLAELLKTLKTNGFSVPGAAAIVTEHSMSHIAKGRPNAEDAAELKKFANSIDLDLEASVIGDADAPYYVPKQENGEPAKFLKAVPKTDADKCINCGLCASLCPMGSINSDNTNEIIGVCIKCHACVNGCKEGAKYFDDEQLLSHIRMLQNTFAERKENTFF